MKYIVLTIMIFLLPVTLAAQTVEKVQEHSMELLHEFDQDQQLDSTEIKVHIPNMIPMILPAEWFIPDSRLAGYAPWSGAPITRPIVFYFPETGISSLIGAGAYSQSHPDKFFSTFNGNNIIDLPQLYRTEQRFLGNTLRLGKNSKFYFVNGILYGAQMGIRGNNWGMGTREGILWRPNDRISVLIWDQAYQSLRVYTPILYPTPDGDTAAVLMPATPEVLSFGVQASFIVGDFIIGVGTSVTY
jgi:hypothetical protein